MSWEAWGDGDDGSEAIIDGLIVAGWRDADDLSTAMHDIIDERLRQENKEGWTPEHDDGHTDGSLAMAAALYATPVQLYEFGLSEFDVPQFTDPWPWKDMLHGQTFGNAWDNREKFDLRRSLVVAGALIAAEIERLDRATEKEAKELANGQNDT